MTFQTTDTTIISYAKSSNTSKPNLPEWMDFAEANHYIKMSCPNIFKSYCRAVQVSLHTLAKNELIIGRKTYSGWQYQRESIEQLEEMLQIKAEILQSDLKEWCDNLHTVKEDLECIERQKSSAEEKAAHAEEMAEYWLNKAAEAQKDLMETLNELNPEQELLENKLSSLRNNPPKLNKKEIKKMRKWATRTIPVYSFGVPKIEIDQAGNLQVRH